MEMGCIGFLLGALVCLVFTGIGVCFGRNDKESHDRDSDVNVYVPMRNRNRSGNKRNYEPSEEEINQVISGLLMDYKNSLSNHEKEVLNHLKSQKEDI